MAKIKLTIPNLESAIKQIGKFRIEKIQEVVGEMDRTTLAIESGAKRNLTNNKSVDTGRLRSSVHRVAIGKFTRSVGTNVEYAAALEFGFDGEVAIPTHERRRFEKEEVSGARAKKEKWVKNHVGTHTVSAHTRKMNITAKPYLFPAAEDERQNFINNLKRILSTP